jgi:hypothetical protein
MSGSPRLQHLSLGQVQEPQGDFAGWTDDQARALINDLVALVRDKLTFNAPMRKPCCLTRPVASSQSAKKPINLAERFQLKTWICGALGGRAHLLRYQ